MVNFAINKDRKSLKMLNKIVEKKGTVISAIIYFISNLETWKKEKIYKKFLPIN